MNRILHVAANSAVKKALQNLRQDPDFGEDFNALNFKEQFDVACKMVAVQRMFIQIFHYLAPLAVAAFAIWKSR